jgi:uncharacterized protein YjbJ (UPF0337 family)
MDSSTNDQAAGTLHQLRGKVKEVAGFISDSPRMRAATGVSERSTGKVQQKIGQFNQFWGK